MEELDLDTRANDNQEEEEEEVNEEEAVIRCVCQQTDENGHNWVQCDLCKVWQHQNCIGLEGKRLPKHKNYYCELCRPTDHPYFKLLAKQSSSVKTTSSAKQPPVTPARRRNTMNSMDASDGFAGVVADADSSIVPNPDALDDSTSTAESSPKSGGRRKKTGNIGKRRSRDFDESAGESDDTIVKRRLKLEDSDKPAHAETLIKALDANGAASKPKSRAKKPASTNADVDHSRQPSPSVTATTSFRGSPAVASPRVPAAELSIPAVKEDPNHLPFLSSSSSDMMVIDAPPSPPPPPQTDFKPHQQPLSQSHPTSTLVKSKSKLSSKSSASKSSARSAANPPSPSASLLNSVVGDGAYEPPSGKTRVATSGGNRISLADIKQRVSHVSDYVRRIQDSKPFQPRDPTKFPCHCTSGSSLSSSASSSSSSRYPSEMSSSGSDSDCSLLTPPLSTTSPSPVFNSVGKAANLDSNSESAEDVALISSHAKGGSTATSTAGHISCDSCLGFLYDGEESSLAILERLHQRLLSFSQKFGN
ncbi:hypothetical protein BDR26DRAFT_859274 [Obelidium mucronatum]|nr:hypothetical protein BDR26DRAFT_859274 [Obelidium mucronatum]